MGGAGGEWKVSLQQTADLLHDRFDSPGEGDEAVLGCDSQRFFRQPQDFGWSRLIKGHEG